VRGERKVIVAEKSAFPNLAKVFAATPRAAAVTPAVATMLDVLREVSRNAANASA